MSFVLLGLGLVFCIEGLALALAPSRLEEALQLLAKLPVDTRRILGLFAVGFGVFMIWVARTFLGA